MENKMFKKITVSFIVCLILGVILSGCYMPSPLYGTWRTSDNSSSITFTPDDFTASIQENDDTLVKISGTWAVNNSTLVLKPVNGENDTSERKIMVGWGFTERSYSHMVLYWTALDGTQMDIMLFLESK